MAREFNLSVEADLENLREVRSFIKKSGQTLGVDEEVLGDLGLVVDEAVTNVILHGYEGKEGTVEVQVKRDEDALVIYIRDQARIFTASEVETPHLEESLAEREYGGMGVYLIRKLTDEHEFRPLPGQGNELRLVKRGVFR